VQIQETGEQVQNYSFNVVWSVEDEKYVATSAEFPGLSGLGYTAADALSELSVAIDVAVEALVEDGEPVPEPRVVQAYSGQLRLRLPRGLHAAAAARAEEEQVSLNALLQAYIAIGLGEARAGASVAQELSAVKRAIGALTQQVANVGQPRMAPASRDNPRQHVVYGAPGWRGGRPGGRSPRIPHGPRDADAREFYDRKPGQRTTVTPEPSAPVYGERALQ
jgi:predicted RNase H-like HicB family nuclease